MSAILRVLGQLYPSAGVESVLYTCATTSVVISSLIVCNISPSNDTVSVRICIAGAADTNAQLIYSNILILGNGALDLTAGITLATTDIIKVKSTNGTCSFQIFGQENS
jgi:hypothetical protein